MADAGGERGDAGEHAASIARHDPTRIAQLAVDNAPIGIALVALDGTWLQVNAELCRILGYTSEELLSESFQTITHPDDLSADLRLLEDTVAGHRTGYRMEKRYLRPDGSVVWAQLDVVLVRDGGEPLYLISQLQDIGHRKDAEARLSQLALHDSLTDLPNRLLFRDRLEQALRRSVRAGRSVAVGFIDLDDFKLVNDTRGHDVGDALLLRAARRMAGALRPGDTLARFGGDEFVALIDDMPDGEAAEQLALRLLAALELPVEIGAESFTITASVGLVLSTPSSTVDDLLRHADLAMYEAKRQGKNRTALYTQVLEEVAVRRVVIERELRQGLDDGELRPAYQPVVDLGDGRIVGYEVLARWHRPDGKVTAAADFIEVASLAGLLPRLTLELLDRVDADLPLLAFPDDGALLLNMTPEVLAAPGIEARLVALARALPHARCLVLEMTESSLLRLDGSAAAVLARVRADGLRFSVDDFGTGYSALSLLSQIEPDIIKIDRTFVSELDRPFPRAIVAAVCAITDEMGISTIGEGVESEEQADQLRALGCSAAQGFHFGYPLPAGG